MSDLGFENRKSRFFTLCYKKKNVFIEYIRVIVSREWEGDGGQKE